MRQRPRWLQGLNNPIFARLYLAQTINLVGDSLTWLGLALLAFELVEEQAGEVFSRGAYSASDGLCVVVSHCRGDRRSG